MKVFLPENFTPASDGYVNNDTKKKENTEPFVAGRSSEIESLKKTLLNWRKGQQSLIILTGSSGNGKSSLSKIVSHEVLKDDKLIKWYNFEIFFASIF